MKLPFITLPDFAGKEIIVKRPHAAASGGHDQAPLAETAGDGWQFVLDRVQSVLKDETITKVTLLSSDPNGFNNTLFRIDTQREEQPGTGYFLKILGRREGNYREIHLWRLLGYNDEGRRVGRPWFPGLPPRVFAWADFNCVLTDYCPGRLSAIPGGSYEFPMVLAATHFINRTLNFLHENGIIYMDLWPGNILYRESGPNKPITFYLADMGSVKALQGHQQSHPAWPDLLQSLTPDRRTRRDTLPPEDRFPDPINIHESEPGYDYHTLARTALILMGFNSLQTLRDELAERFGNHLHLEDPLAPTQTEVSAFSDLLEPMLAGHALDQQALYQQFIQFFQARAQFCARYIDRRDFKTNWINTLTGRINRYKMILTQDHKQTLRADIQTTADADGPGGFERDMAALTNIPNHLLEGNYQEAVHHFQTLSDGELLTLCPSARYSHDYHLKILKILAGSHPEVIAFLSQKTSGSNRLEQRPEALTLERLRRQPNTRLDLLNRRLAGQTQG